MDEFCGGDLFAAEWEELDVGGGGGGDYVVVQYDFDRVLCDNIEAGRGDTELCDPDICGDGTADESADGGQSVLV